MLREFPTTFWLSLGPVSRLSLGFLWGSFSSSPSHFSSHFSSKFSSYYSS